MIPAFHRHLAGTGRTRRQWLSTCLIVSMAGCASPPRSDRTADAGAGTWSGRLSLQMDSEPPQSFHAGFELSGRPSEGDLRLLSPLGTLLSRVQWSDQNAILTQGSETSRHASLDDLVTTVTGAPLPVRALFDWLQAKPTVVPGWAADLSRLAEGRLSARRLHPAPAALLRIILDP